MSQSTPSYFDGFGSESSSIGSQQSTSGGFIQIPTEMFRGVADSTLFAENEQYKLKLTKAHEKIWELEHAFADQGIELYKIKKENETLYKKLQMQDNTSANPTFYPIYDPRMFTDSKGNHPSSQWVSRFWDVIFTHSQNTSEDGSYYIENSTSVMIVYKIVHESNRIAYKFTGSYDDYSMSWNANVATRCTDVTRIEELTCKGESIKAEYNKKHWKEQLVGNLERMPEKSDSHSLVYSKANTIVTRLLPDLQALPTG